MPERVAGRPVAVVLTVCIAASPLAHAWSSVPSTGTTEATSVQHMRPIPADSAVVSVRAIGTVAIQPARATPLDSRFRGNDIGAGRRHVGRVGRGTLSTTSSLTARTSSLMSSRTARRAEPGSSATPALAAPVQLAAVQPLVPGTAAIQPPTAESLDSRFRGNDSNQAMSSLPMRSLRLPLSPTARTFSSASSRAAHTSSLTSSRTAHRAEPGSSATPALAAPVRLAAVQPLVPSTAAIQPPTAESLDSRPRGNDTSGASGTDIGAGSANAGRVGRDTFSSNTATQPFASPLAAAVRRDQQDQQDQGQTSNASAVVAQAPIGPGNDVLPRAWYDTTPGRIGIFIGASVIASAADRGVHDWALRHRNDAFNRDIIKTRDILPWPAFWLAAATSFPSPWANDKLAHTSTVALGSAVITGAETLALKAVIGRDRPGDSNSPYSFTAFNPRYGLIYGGSSFPSGHTALTWALITPYARAYHMPWLYALGVASGAGRVMQNAHWFSDVVGASLLGYFTARWTEEHMNPKANVQWVFTGNGLYMFKSF